MAAAGGKDHVGAGPALVISFLLVAVACGFAALCYAEFTSMVPVSGSAYTYAYATLGELVAWIIGWDLILEYAVGNVAVAISWSGYLQQLLHGLGVHYPLWLGTDYRTALQGARHVAEAVAAHRDPGRAGAGRCGRRPRPGPTRPQLAACTVVFNLPAFAITMLVTWVLVLGIRESAGFNTVMVVIKLVFLAFFIGVGAFYVRPENWTPFAPNGFAGISSAAAIIFFAYIGFDAISTAAEETRHPQRDLPIAILASLVVCTVIYIVTAVVLTGMVPWKQLGTAEPLATAFSARGLNASAGLVSFRGAAGHHLRAAGLPAWPGAASSSPWRGTACCRPGRRGCTRGIAPRISTPWWSGWWWRFLRPSPTSTKWSSCATSAPSLRSSSWRWASWCCAAPTRPGPARFGCPSFPGCRWGRCLTSGYLMLPIAAHHLGPVLRVAGPRVGDLFRLRHPPQPAGAARACQSSAFTRSGCGRGPLRTA